MYKLEELNNSKVTELKEIAKKLNISNYEKLKKLDLAYAILCLLYTSPSPRDVEESRMPSSA